MSGLADFFKKLFSSGPIVNNIPDEGKDKGDSCELEGWEKPFLSNFREEKAPVSKLTKETFNKEDFSLNLEISQETEKQLSLNFMEENVVRFFSKNASKTSQFTMDHVLPLGINQNKAPEFEYQENAEHIDIVPKDQALNFKIRINRSPFSIDVLTCDDKRIIGVNHKNCLNSSPHLALDFQFEHEYLYGIPERSERFLLPDTTDSVPYRMYNLDRFGFDPFCRSGTYGAIPLLVAPVPGQTVGLFWRNASLTWVDIKKRDKKANCFWLSEAGDMEFYIIPAKNVQELFLKLGKMFGFSVIPPYFSLGYHHSRYSFEDQKDILGMDKNFDLHKVPIDVFHLDIDYTEKMKYFTWDPKCYPDPLAMMDKLNEKGRALVAIIDPHIKKQKGYFVCDQAVAKKYFVQNDKKEDYLGSCWPGYSHWLDYLNTDVQDFWASCFAYDKFKHSRPNTHIWNDMNEPSVFTTPDGTMHKNAVHRVKGNNGQDIFVDHREVHNIYGHMQVKGTYKGLVERNKDKNQRPFILTRSFYAGIQKWAAVWTGDTLCKWQYLKNTLPMLLTLSMTGVNFCGGDIGGFYNDPTDELQVRWFQSAVIYPFFRGHSAKQAKRREPWLYEEKVKNALRDVIVLRYELIPYLYTLFYECSKTNIPILRPLWYLLPEKMEIYGVDDQMMLGDGILSCPILDDKQKTVSLKTVNEFRWFCLHTFKEVSTEKEINVDELSYNPLFLKEGSILVWWDIRKKPYFHGTRDLLEKFDYKLVVVVDKSEKARGTFYMDDGVSFDHLNKENFIYSEFTFEKGTLIYTPKAGNRQVPHKNKLRTIEITGLSSDFDISKARFNRAIDFVIRHDVASKTTSIKVKATLEMFEEWKFEVYSYN